MGRRADRPARATNGVRQTVEKHYGFDMNSNYNDEASRETAEIARGTRVIDPRYRDLAEAISERFQVDVMNVALDTFRPAASFPERLRLWIWLRTENDARSFSDSPFSYDLAKQQAVALMAQSFLLSEPGRRRMKLLSENPFVAFTSLEKPAIEQAIMQASDHQLEGLRVLLANEDLWRVQTIFARVIFFVHTDEQARGYKGTQEFDRWADAFFALVKPYDEFDFLSRERFRVELDSKETFYKVAHGNWAWYS